MPDFPVEDTDEMLAASAYGEVPFGPTPLNFSLPQPPASVMAPPAVAPPPIQAPQGRQINPGNWVYAGSRLPGEAPVQFPDQPPDVQTGYGINRFDLPGGVAAYHVSQDYQERQRELDRQAAAARQARDQAVEDARIMDQMMRVARSTKDIEAAQRSIQVMHGMRQLQAGVPLSQVAMQNPLMFGSQLGATLRATATQPATSYVPPTGGAPGYVVDPRGVPHFPPNTGQLPEAGVKVLPDGTRIIQVSPEKWQVLDKGPVSAKEGSLNDRQKAELREIDRQAHDLRLSLPTNPNSQAYIDGQQALGELDLKRRKILNAAGGAQPRATVVSPPNVGVTGIIHKIPTSKADLVVGDLYDHPTYGVGRWTGTKFEAVKTR